MNAKHSPEIHYGLYETHEISYLWVLCERRCLDVLITVAADGTAKEFQP